MPLHKCLLEVAKGNQIRLVFILVKTHFPKSRKSPVSITLRFPSTLFHFCGYYTRSPAGLPASPGLDKTKSERREQFIYWLSQRRFTSATKNPVLTGYLYSAVRLLRSAAHWAKTFLISRCQKKRRIPAFCYCTLSCRIYETNLAINSACQKESVNVSVWV